MGCSPFSTILSHGPSHPPTRASASDRSFSPFLAQGLSTGILQGDFGASILAQLRLVAQGVADRARGHEDAALLAGPGQTPLHVGVAGVVGGPISGPAGADVSSTQVGGYLNARGGHVARVLARVRVAGRARVARFEGVGRVRERGGEEGEEEEGSEDGFHG